MQSSRSRLGILCLGLARWYLKCWTAAKLLCQRLTHIEPFRRRFTFSADASFSLSVVNYCRLPALCNFQTFFAFHAIQIFSPIKQGRLILCLPDSCKDTPASSLFCSYTSIFDANENEHFILKLLILQPTPINSRPCPFGSRRHNCRIAFFGSTNNGCGRCVRVRPTIDAALSQIIQYCSARLLGRCWGSVTTIVFVNTRRSESSCPQPQWKKRHRRNSHD